jgi:hypothetical protein
MNYQSHGKPFTSYYSETATNSFREKNSQTGFSADQKLTPSPNLIPMQKIPEADDCYYPEPTNPQASNTPWWKRAITWLTQCRHDWSINRANGFGIPTECQCLRCGEHRHKIMDFKNAGREIWKIGKHPNRNPNSNSK